MRYEKIGFIGLGQMGQGMAMNLFKGNGQLAIFDLDATRAQTLTMLGAELVESPVQLIRDCDLLFLCLPSSREVEALLFGESGLLTDNDMDNLTLVDTTTLPSPDAMNFARRAEQSGVSYFDCPVSGLPKRADDGSLTVMFGGNQDAFTRLNPYLNMMGNDPIYCGEIGRGQAMKSINNIIYNINIAAICEIVPLALKSGLDNEAVTRVVLDGSSRSFASEHFVPKIKQRIFDGDFPMQGAYKDIENFRSLIAEAGGDKVDESHFPLAQAMATIYENTLDAGHGEQAKSSMIRQYESMLDIEFT